MYRKFEKDANEAGSGIIISSSQMGALQQMFIGFLCSTVGSMFEIEAHSIISMKSSLKCSQIAGSPMTISILSLSKTRKSRDA